jgi:hypothetical protein
MLAIDDVSLGCLYLQKIYKWYSTYLLLRFPKAFQSVHLSFEKIELVVLPHKLQAVAAVPGRKALGNGNYIRNMRRGRNLGSMVDAGTIKDAMVNTVCGG